MSNEIFYEAVRIVANHENVGDDFVIAFYSKQQIMAKCRQYNDEHFDEMDTIRSWW